MNAIIHKERQKRIKKVVYNFDKRDYEEEKKNRNEANGIENELLNLVLFISSARHDNKS